MILSIKRFKKEIVITKKIIAKTISISRNCVRDYISDGKHLFDNTFYQ